MITLALMEKEDLIKVVEWNEGKSADYLLQWSGPVFEHPLTLEQLTDFFEKYGINKEGSDTFSYKILLDATGEIIGTVELREADKEKKIGRVGRFLIGEESMRGKGAGSKALGEIIKIGFQQMGFDKIGLGVFDFNENAIRCYEKIGFVKTELKENYRKTSNGYWNLWDMYITKETWKKNFNIT